MALARAAHRLALYAPRIGEDSAAARRRAFGAAWVDAVEEIRRRIPEDGSYALVDAQPVEQGAYYWIRHDLAPRRAVFLGRMSRLPGPRRLSRRVPGIEWAVVVTGADRPPRLLTVAALGEEIVRHRTRSGTGTPAVSAPRR
jgi:hypothetical protein